MKYLKQHGYTVAITERWNAWARIKQDLFGIVDLLALRGGQTLAVQTTSGSNVAARCRKIANSEHIAAIREAGWTVHVHGWRKGKNGRYQLRIVDVS